MHERADCDPRRMVLVHALEGFRRRVSTWGRTGARAPRVCARLSSAGCAVCVYRITATVQVQRFSIHAIRPANPPRDSRVIREPNRFWIYEKFPSRRFISVEISRERNTAYFSGPGDGRSAGKPRNSRDFISHRLRRASVV